MTLRFNYSLVAFLSLISVHRRFLARETDTIFIVFLSQQLGTSHGNSSYIVLFHSVREASLEGEVAGSCGTAGLRTFFTMLPTRFIRVLRGL